MLGHSKLALPGYRIALRDTNLWIGDLAGGSRFNRVRARRHGNHDVRSLLAVRFRNAQEHLILMDAELGGLANREQCGVLVVFRADAVDQAIRLENVFLAQQFLGVLVLSVGAEDFAGKRLAIFFGKAATGGIHLHQDATLVSWLILGRHRLHRLNAGDNREGYCRLDCIHCRVGPFLSLVWSIVLGLPWKLGSETRAGVACRCRDARSWWSR